MYTTELTASRLACKDLAALEHPGLHQALHPLPARNEWGEDRGEGQPIKTHLLSPALSSIRWRRGRNPGARCSPGSVTRRASAPEQYPVPSRAGPAVATASSPRRPAAPPASPP